MSDTREDIKQLREEFDGIDRAIVDGAKNMKTMQATLSRTNAIMGSKNWEVFSRFISGTGLWRVQNRIKATVILLNEMASSTERRRLEEVKQLKVYAEIADQAEEIQKIQDNIKLAENASGQARENALQALRKKSKIFGGLLFQYQDENKALKEMSKLMDKQVKDIEKLEKAATKGARRRKEGLIANSLTVKLSKDIAKYSKIGFENVKNKVKAQKQVIAATEKVNELSEKVTEKITPLFGPVAAMEKKFKEFGAKPDSKIKERDPSISSSRFQIGNKFLKTAEGPEKIKEFKRLKLLMKIAKATEYAATPLTNMAKFLGRIAKGIVLIIRSMVMAAGYLLLVMLILTLLKSVYDETKEELILGFNKMKEVFSIGMAMVSSGLADAKDALERIWAGFQEGDILEVVLGVGELLLAGLTVLGGLIVATLGAVLAGIGTYLLELGRTGYDAIFEATGSVEAAIIGGGLKILSVVMRVVAAVAFLAVFFGGGWIAVLIGALAVLLWKLAEHIYKNLDNIVIYLSAIKIFAATIITTLAGLPEQIGNFIGDKFKEAMDVTGAAKDRVGGALSSAKNFIGLAEGGRVSQSGLAVVGERGPELVQLPRGAQVHSNSASKAIASSVTNNITVQVTGRVGANDAEIRDIANKVAREINSRMNRTTTSVVKF